VRLAGLNAWEAIWLTGTQARCHHHENGEEQLMEPRRGFMSRSNSFARNRISSHGSRTGLLVDQTISAGEHCSPTRFFRLTSRSCSFASSLVSVKLFRLSTTLNKPNFGSFDQQRKGLARMGGGWDAVTSEQLRWDSAAIRPNRQSLQASGIVSVSRKVELVLWIDRPARNESFPVSQDRISKFSSRSAVSQIWLPSS